MDKRGGSIGEEISREDVVDKGTGEEANELEDVIEEEK